MAYYYQKPQSYQNVQVPRIEFYGEQGPYGCFSSNSPHKFKLKKKKWPTIQHYFQAQKFVGTKLEKEIRKAKSPDHAKKLGGTRSVKLRWDWDQVKENIMYEALEAKFTQNPGCLNVLLGTGRAQLLSTSSYDRYWSRDQNGSGRNRMGLLLMRLRDQLSKNYPNTGSNFQKDLAPKKSVGGQLNWNVRKTPQQQYQGGNGPIYFYYETDPLYGCFSNYSPHKFVLEEKVWTTSEHYFQAKKFANTQTEEDIRRMCTTPGEAKKLANSKLLVNKRRYNYKEWDLVKERFMYMALKAKFSQNAGIKKTLMNTGNRKLFENAPKDSYWGIGNGTGQNRLGTLLSMLRYDFNTGKAPLIGEGGKMIYAPKVLRPKAQPAQVSINQTVPSSGFGTVGTSSNRKDIAVSNEGRNRQPRPEDLPPVNAFDSIPMGKDNKQTEIDKFVEKSSQSGQSTVKIAQKEGQVGVKGKDDENKKTTSESGEVRTTTPQTNTTTDVQKGKDVGKEKKPEPKTNGREEIQAQPTLPEEDEKKGKASVASKEEGKTGTKKVKETESETTKKEPKEYFKVECRGKMHRLKVGDDHILFGKRDKIPFTQVEKFQREKKKKGGKTWLSVEKKKFEPLVFGLDEEDAKEFIVVLVTKMEKFWKYKEETVLGSSKKKKKKKKKESSRGSDSDDGD